MSFASSRRRMIADHGRPMTLRRLLTTTTATNVDLTGYLTAYLPAQVGAGAIMQGDASVAITNDEIITSAWPGPPRARDILVVDGRNWAVMGSAAVYDGPICIGHNLHVRGG